MTTKYPQDRKIFKRYAIISKGLVSDFAHDKKYRYRGIYFITKSSANKYFNKLPYEQQRNQKVVMFTMR